LAKADCVLFFIHWLKPVAIEHKLFMNGIVFLAKADCVLFFNPLAEASGN
jgi:hypothetical protein